MQEYIRRADQLYVLHNNVSSLSPWRDNCIIVNYALQIFAAPTRLLREVLWDPMLKTAEHEERLLLLHLHLVPTFFFFLQ